MKLGLVPLSDKDSEKIKKVLNTSPEFEKLVECIESEMEFNRSRLAETLFPAAALKTELSDDARFGAISVLRMQQTLEVLKEFLEPDYKLHTLSIDK